MIAALVDRRGFLRGAATGALAATGAALSGRAGAQDALLTALIDQTQNGDFGQGFDSASRTIQMPKASLPTLSPATVAEHRAGDRALRGIVARGGWPQVPKTDRLRLGAAIRAWSRCASG